ncbi:hypothetical protein BS78_K206900 [Paspalum vaginatum]|uniref:QLQ domain-containing protein n=1 Tax=Paspalum vaginatum TaxID=158149 RepID=A0A9W8CC50_9POAL|nr:hypothetical protein BS78_K206900 [Paspalum vaginatum]
MMMMSGRAGGGASTGRYPFTASQWQELEHQALIYKCLASGKPIPAYLMPPAPPHPRLRPRHPPLRSHSRRNPRWGGAASDGVRQEAGRGPGARAVPADGRQEVALLQGGVPGLQVLREAHAPGQEPFKKACGNVLGHAGALLKRLLRLERHRHHHLLPGALLPPPWPDRARRPRRTTPCTAAARTRSPRARPPQARTTRRSATPSTSTSTPRTRTRRRRRRTTRWTRGDYAYGQTAKEVGEHAFFSDGAAERERQAAAGQHVAVQAARDGAEAGRTSLFQVGGYGTGSAYAVDLTKEDDEEERRRQQQHCFVLGADLRLERPSGHDPRPGAEAPPALL